MQTALAKLCGHEGTAKEMRVDLALELFQHPVKTLQLDAIADLALSGWHRLIVEDDRDQQFLAWLATLSDAHREVWNEVLSTSYLLESREPAARVIKVCNTSCSVWGLTPQLTPEDASTYLRSPFLALVEDSESDRGFILAIASTEQRRRLEELERVGALRFENGGGITNMPKRIAAELRRPGAIHKIWVLSDTDGMQPGQISAQASKLLNHCQTQCVAHHQLMRRSIENYITIDALRIWAFAEPKKRGARVRTYDAFRALSVVQQSYFNMKEGFIKDAKRNDLDSGSLYDDVSPHHRSCLDTGFGRGISELFTTGHVKEVHLRREPAWPELIALITRLVELVR